MTQATAAASWQKTLQSAASQAAVMLQVLPAASCLLVNTPASAESAPLPPQS